MTIQLLENVKRVILNPIIYLLFAFALFVFISGIIKYLNEKNDGKASTMAEGARYIFWGAAGMAIMVSVYGLLNFVSNTVRSLFGI